MAITATGFRTSGARPRWEHRRLLSRVSPTASSDRPMSVAEDGSASGWTATSTGRSSRGSAWTPTGPSHPRSWLGEPSTTDPWWFRRQKLETRRLDCCQPFHGRTEVRLEPTGRVVADNARDKSRHTELGED